MRPGNTLLLLFAIFSLASTKAIVNVGSHRKPLPPVDPRIIPFCNQTHSPEVCINSARLYADRFPVIDATNMFNMLIKALQDRIQVVTTRTKVMSRSLTSDKMINCINSCLEYYDDATDCTKEGLEAFIARDEGTFVTRLSSAITMFSSCNDGFVDFSLPNPLEVYNNRLMHMAGNCIAVGKMTFKDAY